MITDANEVEVGTPVEYTYNREDKFDGGDSLVTVSKPGMITGVEDNTLTVEDNKRTLTIDLPANTATVTDHNLFKTPPDEQYRLENLTKLTVADIHFSLEDFSDKNQNRDSIEETITRANETLNHITDELGEQWLIEHDWITKYDVIKCNDIKTDGIKELIDSHNSNLSENASTITFNSDAEVIMWTQEILGQISDGVWENDAIDWKHYHQLEIKVDESRDSLTTTSHTPNNLNFEEKLQSYDGLLARMMFFAMVAQPETNITLTNIQTFLKHLDKKL